MKAFLSNTIMISTVQKGPKVKILGELPKDCSTNSNFYIVCLKEFPVSIKHVIAWVFFINKKETNTNSDLFFFISCC